VDKLKTHRNKATRILHENQMKTIRNDQRPTGI